MATTTTPSGILSIPPLESGDHLSRDEFERRYEAMPDVRKAELIEGIVYMPSPVRMDRHGSPQARLIWWLTHYEAFTPGVRACDNSTVRIDLDNEPQPDGLLIVEPACGGRVTIAPDDYIEGAPELVAEIEASSASFDLHTKLRVYRRNGVKEYLVWRTLEQAIDWFVLKHSAYVQLALTPEGSYQSESFPGLWLDPAALVRRDLPAVLSVLQRGLASPEHATFAEQLRRAAASE